MDDERASENVLTLNPIVGVSREDLVQAALGLARGGLRHPAIFLRHALGFWQREVDVLFGLSELTADRKDARFADAGYREEPFHRALLQSWLALEQTLREWVDDLGLESLERERARFLVQVAADALAPSNFLLGNPSALRRARDTRAESVLRGLRNLVVDLIRNGGMPAQVDKSAFRVGENLATSVGAVVFRHPILELIQYRPLTPSVAERPVLIVPPQINKYYIYDLSPEKSLVRFLLEQGFQVFMISWRNPTAEQRDWGLADYVEAIDAAIDATCAVSGFPDVDAVGACAGGITLAAAAGSLAARGRGDRLASLTLMVNVLDIRREDSIMSLFATDDAIESARKRSARKGVLDGRDAARVFNWMRPNDLIWSYVVNNYLLGDSPPAFDVLYWNNDTTRLPARLHSDFLDIFKDNSFTHPGALQVRGVPVDLGKLTVPVFITGGTTDHITPWQACYRSTQLFGGPSSFVLSTAGHIQSLINPPGSSKRKFFTNPLIAPDAEAWRAHASEHSGSWWPLWSAWLRERSRGDKPAPAAFGGPGLAPLCDAPGTYVLE